jgi:hypothetical protein
MPAIRLARRPAVRLRGLARAGLVLLAALASVLVAGRPQVPPTVRTSSVGRVPMAWSWTRAPGASSWPIWAAIR